jgi:hypothetical protein
VIVERKRGEKSKRSMTISSCEQHGYRRFRRDSASLSARTRSGDRAICI